VFRAAKRVRADPILNFIDGKLNPHRRASYRRCGKALSRLRDAGHAGMD
jgi:hypothetical protein